jgi:hypothetical protein
MLLRNFGLTSFRLGARPNVDVVWSPATGCGAVAGVVGIEVGVVSGVFNLESSGVDAPDWRPRHEEH